jgi:hypothetical protein
VSEVAEVRERFRTALDLFDVAVRMMRQNLRRKHPSVSDAEIETWVHDWLRHRPGAEHGDAEGTQSELPRHR